MTDKKIRKRFLGINRNDVSMESADLLPTDRLTIQDQSTTGIGDDPSLMDTTSIQQMTLQHPD